MHRREVVEIAGYSGLMDWDDLRFLLALSRTGSHSAAAKLLGVTHTTVARRIQGLEEALSARLFDRTDTGYVATAAGEDLKAVALRMEEELLSVDRRLLGQDARLSGRLRVATVDLLAARHACDIAAFSERYPEVKLELVVSNAFHNLSRREADVALRVTTANPPDHLVGKRLGRMELALYGARSLVERMGSDAPLSDYPWLAWDDRYDARLTEARRERHAPGARVVCRFDSSVIQLAAVRAGQGIAFVTCASADQCEDLVRLRPVEEDFGMDLWLLTHPDLRHTARVRAFMDHMTRAMEPWRERMLGRRSPLEG